MKVKVGIGASLRAGRAAVDDMYGFLDDMEHDLEEAALTERLTHAYENQTGHLQAGTGAGVVSDSANELQIDLEMGDFYASYVAEKGYSDFPETAARTEEKLDKKFAAVEQRAGRR